METTNIRPVVQSGDRIFFRALGTTYRVLSNAVNGSAAIVEHTLEAKSIGAPMHKHTYEDEISYIVEGTLSVIQNGKVQTAGPGEYIVKPRGIFHTFWNSGEERIRWVEVITPGNFEYYFAEVAPFLEAGKPPQMEKVRELVAKYGLLVEPGGGLIEMLGVTTIIFSVNRGWRAMYPVADAIQKVSLKSNITAFYSVWDSIFFVLLIAFLLATIFFGWATWQEKGLGKLLSWLFWLAAPLTILIIFSEYAGLAWADAPATWVYPVLQPVSRSILGIYLIKGEEKISG